MGRRVLSTLLVLAMALGVVLGGGAGCTPKDVVSENDAGGTASQEPTTGPTEEGPPSLEVTETVIPPNTPATLKVRLYFGYEDRVMAVEREIPYTTGVAKATMLELLKGPSAADLKGLALHTEIPVGTKLNSVSIANGVARVDLSDQFDDGGGTLSVTMRLAQVVYTLCQFPTIDSVEFYMGGEKVEVFSGEGLMLDGPQTPEDYYSLIPVDA